VVLVILARTKQHFFKMKNQSKIASVSEFLSPDLVVFMNAKGRDEALTLLVEALEQQDKLFDKEAFFDAIMKREQIVSTGIGMGVAIPHAKLPGFEDFFIAIGIQQGHEGIDWDALDGSSVRLIFMIGGPPDRQTDYLKILSRLTMAIKDEKRRMGLTQCQKGFEVIEWFQGC
jgi:PTS system nitrogen regulatory IIA component